MSLEIACAWSPIGEYSEAREKSIAEPTDPELDFKHVRRQQVGDLETGRRLRSHVEVLDNIGAVVVCSTGRLMPLVRQQQLLRAVLADGLLHQVRVIRKQAMRWAKVFRGPRDILPENPCYRMARTSGHRRRVTVRLTTLIQGRAQTLGQPVALRQPLRGLPLRRPRLFR